MGRREKPDLWSRKRQSQLLVEAPGVLLSVKVVSLKSHGPSRSSVMLKEQKTGLGLSSGFSWLCDFNLTGPEFLHLSGRIHRFLWRFHEVNEVPKHEAWLLYAGANNPLFHSPYPIPTFSEARKRCCWLRLIDVEAKPHQKVDLVLVGF